MAITYQYPHVAFGRGAGLWLNPMNWIASRRKFRRDYSAEWRARCEAQAPPPPARSTAFEALLMKPVSQGFRFAILGDTGEGDYSQYALLPLLRALNPDFIIINGDVAYPAGRDEDFREGFFEPYEGLGIPIWAVPGNHEYYSPNNGREFYEVFCTDARAADWQKYGLRHVKQPGMYWELQSDTSSLVVLGVDSGMTASLDYSDAGPGDPEQLDWVRWRLRVADDNGKRVVVLFHIPALVGEETTKARLTLLHKLLATSPSVRAVITAHEHGFQYYTPAVFRKFSDPLAGTAAALPPVFPHYMVSGGGGATLSAVGFEMGKGPFAAAKVFPDIVQWRRYASLVKRGVAGFGKSILAKVIVSVEAALRDQDPDKFPSLVLIDVQNVGGVEQITLTPFLQESLEALYGQPPPPKILVKEGLPPVPPGGVAASAWQTFAL